MSEPGSSGGRELSESLSRLCNAVCDRFEAAWQAVTAGGPRPFLKEFLPDLSEPDRSVLLHELILLDVYYRRLAGETCTAADYQQPFAGLDPTWLADALQVPAVADPVRTTTEGTASPATGSVADLPAVASTSLPPAGASVEPRYIRERLHATGGIGQVWVARDQSIGRQVALKELRPDRAGNADLRRRFLTEARVTGQLEHPGIVPVYEVAWNPADGQPFYAMRLIKGATLSEAAADYHRKRRRRQAGPLDLRGLLDVFVAVCNVVAYAHSRGVLHRDLKGQNVVLGNYGEVFVLDWGLAKVVGASAQPAAAAAKPADDSTPATALETTTLAFPDERLKPEDASRQVTVEGQVLGTPGYMAPEQAAGQPEQIDERTDVYGLGAILYEILTGQAPFPGKDLETILARVRQAAPLAPRAVNPDVDAALEAICLKALSKAPAARFGSARDLAQQVRCFLAGEPVACYPDPWGVRLRRWMGRHRTLVTGTAAAGLVAVVALGVATMLLKAANDRQRQSRLAAEDNLRLAQDVVDRYLVRVSSDERLKSLGMEKLRRDLLLQAKGIYEQFVLRGADTPNLQVQRGKALHGLGLIENEIGEQDKARALYEEAFVVLQRLVAARTPEAEAQDSLAQVARDLALWHHIANHPDLARTYFDQALEIHRWLADVPGALPASRYQLALTLHRFGRFSVHEGKQAAGKTMLDEAVGVLRELADEDDRVPEYPDLLAQCYHILSRANAQLGLRDEVEPMLQASLKVRERLNRSHPDVPAYEVEYANTLVALGNWYTDHQGPGHKERAAGFYQQALSDFDRLAYYHPDVPEYDKKRAITWLLVAGLALVRKAPEELKQALEVGQSVLNRLAKEHPGDNELAPLLLQFRMLDAAWYALVGNHAQAAQLLEQRRAELMQAHYAMRMTSLASYNIATFYCLAAEVAQHDPLLASGARNDAADRYLIQALQTLKQARAAGCFGTALSIHSFKTDNDLNLLRKRDDFQKWVKEVEAEVGASSK
jgi:serine/threonine protein kinase